MNVLEKLREDVLASLRFYTGDTDEGRSPRAVLDEFINGREVVEVDFDPDSSLTPESDRCWYESMAEPLCGGGIVSIIVPRVKQERKPAIPDRIAHLEDEVHERCGDLGRRVGLLEYRAGAKIGGRPVDVPIREAALAVEAWCRNTPYWRGMAGLHPLVNTLAAALSREAVDVPLREAAEAASDLWQREGALNSGPMGMEFCRLMERVRAALAKEAQNDSA